MAGYVTRAEVRNFTGNNEYSDTALDEMIARIEGELDEATHNRYSGTQNFVEVLSGDGTSSLQLSRYPVDSVSLIEVNNGSEWVSYGVSNVIVIDPNIIALAGTNSSNELEKFPEGVNNIRISYSYGYSSVPQHIKRYVLLKIAADINLGLKKEYANELAKLEDMIYNAAWLI